MPAKCCSRFWTAERNELHFLAYFSMAFRVDCNEPLIQETTHGREVILLESQVPKSQWLQTATTEENRRWYGIKKTVLDKQRG